MRASSGRRRSQHARGQSAVEFALLAPFAFLILLGLVVLGIVVLHEIQLSQAVRDSARAAAICGKGTNATQPPVPTLPDSNLPCTNANLVAYINARLTKVDPSLANTATVTVYSDTHALVGATGTGANAGAAAVNCSATVVKSASGVVTGAYTVEVSVTYAQPLYLPLVGAVFGTGGGNTRTIAATGEATCEQ